MSGEGLAQFTRAKRRVLPLIILLDASGSMNEIIDERGMVRTGQTIFMDGREWEVVTGGRSKLQITNDAMRVMIEAFGTVDRADVQVSVIAFGGSGPARVHLPLESSGKVQWQDYQADGDTPMGSAFQLAKQLMEDRSTIPSDAYRPTIVLISDGMPTDANWEASLQALIGDGRSKKAARMALGIGTADRRMLEKFLGEKNRDYLFEADQAAGMIRFFNFLTMSTAQRTNSAKPDEIPKPNEIPKPEDIDEF